MKTKTVQRLLLLLLRTQNCQKKSFPNLIMSLRHVVSLKDLPLEILFFYYFLISHNRWQFLCSEFSRIIVNRAQAILLLLNELGSISTNSRMGVYIFGVLCHK